MVNRILIRILVVQTLYSYLINKDSKETAANKLKNSLDTAYQLYFYLLTLPVALTELQRQRLEAAKNKYLPSPQDLNPNTRFVDNTFAATIAENAIIKEFVTDNCVSWSDDEIYLRLILDKILDSDIYADYMEKPKVTGDDDAEFWRQVMRKIVLPDEDLAEVLEAKSVFWNDDLEIVGTFALKTFKRMASNPYKAILPQFKDEEDAQFGYLLLNDVIDNYDDYLKLIDKFIPKSSWDISRIPVMDIVVLQIAIAELLRVPSVPVVVTINEYVELAKYYSTAKSGTFVNGILYSIITHLKSEGILLKPID